jgi:hypothetical protein
MPLWNIIFKKSECNKALAAVLTGQPGIGESLHAHHNLTYY